MLIACAFNYDAHSSEFDKLGRIPVLKARMNADLHMADDLKNTGKGNLFVIFGEPDIDILDAEDGQVRVKVNGVDVFHPNTGEVRSDGAEGIACWFIDTDYNEESFFVRHAYFLGANDPYKALKTTLKAEINEEAWATLHSDTSRPFDKPKSGRIAVKVINHLGDEVMKVFRVDVMEFRIADTFTDSLAQDSTGDEQKAVKTTAFDLQMNPANPGMQFHKLDKAKDPNFWSVRVSSDIRLIVHRTSASLLLCYVDHHDEAYHWAERRKLETHPKTGAAQLVEIRETVREIVIPRYVEAGAAEPPASRRCSPASTDDELLSYGVPAEWLDDVRRGERGHAAGAGRSSAGRGAEALLEIWRPAGTPQVAQPVAAGADPFEHPDAQRRFRVMNNVEELERALDYPWEKWTVFLHPAQRELVERDYSGPARVSGSAGTGKTIVALHRAVFLARANPDARVLLTTFSDALANALRTKLRRLISNEPRLGERLEVHAMDAIGAAALRVALRTRRRSPRVNVIEQLLDGSSRQAVEGHKFSLHFLLTEWEQVVDAWQLDTWEAYRDVARLGRKTRLPEQQRAVLWSIFEQCAVAARSAEAWSPTPRCSAGWPRDLAEGAHSPFDFVVVDEAQDVSVAQLRFLAALGADRPNSLFFAGDLGQRIFQQPFSWKALGVDIRGRSRTLRVNYRTSHQIRTQADRLLGPELSDVDGNTEERGGHDLGLQRTGADHPGSRLPRRTKSRPSAQWLAERIRRGRRAARDRRLRALRGRARPGARGGRGGRTAAQGARRRR